MHDPAVPQLHQVVHGLPDALSLGGMDEVDMGLGHAAADRDRDRALPEFAEVAGLGVRAEQDHRLAAVAEQRLDRLGLTAPLGGTGEQDVVPEPLGLRIDAGDEIRVEGLVHGEHHSERATAATGQQPGRAVGPVTDLVGHAQDPLPRLPAGSRLVAEDDRNERAGDARLLGHVRHRGPLPARCIHL